LSTTIVEKQETRTSAVAAPRAEKRTDRVPAQIHTAAKEVKTASVEPTDSYPSCLELAADFMARG
jgi:hypothetical protein